MEWPLAYRILVGKAAGKKLLRKSRHTWEAGRKWILKK
jgi:hypothetical protein